MHRGNNYPLPLKQTKPVPELNKYSPHDYNHRIFLNGFNPLILRNIKQQADKNKEAFNRIIPKRGSTKKVVPSYRGSYNVCQDTVNLGPSTKKEEHVVETATNEAIFVPPQKKHPKFPINEYDAGRGKYTSYLDNIDIDSELRQGYRHTKDITKQYNPGTCKAPIVGGPQLLANPVCQNNKIYNFDEHEKYSKYNQNDNLNNIGDLHNGKRPIQNLIDTHLLKFNYSNDEATCAEELLPEARLENHAFAHRLIADGGSMSDIKQPILFQQSSDTPYPHSTPNNLPLKLEGQTEHQEGVWNNCFNASANEAYQSDDFPIPQLPIGPERTLHTLENIWNNVTKRKYI